MLHDVEQVKLDAAKELAEEEHRAKVDLEKRRLKLRKNFWIRIFPWRFRIDRRDVPHPEVVVKKDKYCKKCNHWNCTPEFCHKMRRRYY